MALTSTRVRYRLLAFRCGCAHSGAGRRRMLKPQQRPQIERANIVCAEAMPGRKGTAARVYSTMCNRAS